MGVARGKSGAIRMFGANLRLSATLNSGLPLRQLRRASYFYGDGLKLPTPGSTPLTQTCPLL